jgi:hypothetical protein
VRLLVRWRDAPITEALQSEPTERTELIK